MSRRLSLVEDFINTRSIELATDEIATRDALAAWLRDRGLIGSRDPVSAAGLRRAVRLREGLRALTIVNSGAPAPGGAVANVANLTDLADLTALAHDLPLFVDVAAEPPQLRARSTAPVDAALGTLLAIVAEAVVDGTWPRLKACREPNCQWAYFDESRNRSRAWCSMASCGNRAKARAFRHRTS